MAQDMVHRFEETDPRDTFEIFRAANEAPSLMNISALVDRMELMADRMRRKYPGNRDYARMCDDLRESHDHIARMRQALEAHDKSCYDAAYTGLRSRLSGYHNAVDKLADWRLA